MPGPAPAVAAVRRAVRAALTGMPPGSLVLVACSGGPDSLALAAAAGFVAPRVGQRAGAIVVDHGLQAGSDRVARAAADQCFGLGLAPVEVIRVDVSASGSGPEDAARSARFAALDAAAARHTAVSVLLGHTRDDQAEQVLLGLARGSGARSLSGMPPTRDGYVRPLLGVTRAQTQAACLEVGLVPWHDPHNADARFARVRARRALADLERDLGPGVTAALARSADLLRDDADLLDELAARARAGLATGGDEPQRSSASAKPASDGRAQRRSQGVRVAHAVGQTQGDVRVPADGLADLPDALRRRVWRILAGEAGARPLSAGHVESLDALVMSWRGQGTVDLPGGVVGERVVGSIHLGSRC